MIRDEPLNGPGSGEIGKWVSVLTWGSMTRIQVITWVVCFSPSLSLPVIHLLFPSLSISHSKPNIREWMGEGLGRVWARPDPLTCELDWLHGLTHTLTGLSAYCPTKRPWTWLCEMIKGEEEVTGEKDEKMGRVWAQLDPLTHSLWLWALTQLHFDYRLS